MIVYNITIKIEPSIEAEWVSWQKTEHIPEVMATGQFYEFKFYRLLDQHEQEGLTYVVQYSAFSIDDYNNYIKEYSQDLRQKTFDKWGNQFIAFRTIMQSVD